jgi:hypothetical protein
MSQNESDELGVHRVNLDLDPPIRLERGEQLADIVIERLYELLAHRCSILVRLVIETQRLADDLPDWKFTRSLKAFTFNRDTVTNRAALFEYIQRGAEKQSDKIEVSGVVASVVALRILLVPLPEAGGCSQDHAKVLKLPNALCISPKSKDNNCLINALHLALDQKGNKSKTASVRKACGLEQGAKIPIDCLDKVARYYDIKISLRDANMACIGIFGDPKTTTVVDIRLQEDHYSWIQIPEGKRKCPKCGHKFLRVHTCNLDSEQYFQRKKCGKNSVRRVKRDDFIDEQYTSMDNVVFFDIETFQPDGGYEHVPYAVGWLPTTTNVYKSAYGQGCFDTFVDEILDSDVPLCLVAYNGSGFDFQFLITALIERKVTSTKDILLNNGHLLSLSFSDKKDVVHTIFDLYQFLTCSLDKACKDLKVDASVAKSVLPHLLLKKWGDANYIGPWPEEAHYLVKDRRNLPQPTSVPYNFRQQCLDYLERDVRSLMSVHQKFSDIVFKTFQVNITRFVTLSSMAYKIWQTQLEHNVELAKNERLYTEIRKSYYGGRCHPVKRFFQSSQYEQIKTGETRYNDVNDYIFVADVKSLYPASMVDHDYPVGFCHPASADELKTINAGIANGDQSLPMGIYQVRYIPNKNLVIPILPRRETNGSIAWDLKTSSGFYNSIDLESALRFGYKIKVLGGHIWNDKAPLFNEYVNKLYELKLDAELKKNSVLKTFAKLMMNSLYGKMGQKAMLTEHKICFNYKEILNFIETYDWTDALECGNAILMLGETRNFAQAMNKPGQIGSFITAYSRSIMLDYMLQADSAMGTADWQTSLDNTFYYTDTDSLHIHSSSLPHIESSLGKKIGMLDNDIDNGGKVIKAIYCGSKLYRCEYIDETGKICVKDRAKGIPEHLVPDQFYKDFEENSLATASVVIHSIKKVTTNLSSGQLQKGLSPFTIINETIPRSINATPWRGRDFYGNASLPFGHKINAHLSCDLVIPEVRGLVKSLTGQDYCEKNFDDRGVMRIGFFCTQESWSGPNIAT